MMFANFEICRAGWVQAEVKHRQPRSTTGCLQCRQRKKKCDEKKPICGACFRRNPAKPECTRPSCSASISPRGVACLIEESAAPSASTGSSASTPSIAPGSTTPDLNSPNNQLSRARGHLFGDHQPYITHSFEEDVVSYFESYSSDRSPITHLPMANPRLSLQSPLLETFRSSEERRALQCLTSRFHSMTTSTYENPRFSILAQGLPVATEYPAVRDAFVACGLGTLFRVSSREHEYQLSSKYYNKAISTIASQLMSFPEEPLLATVLLLHILEEVLCDKAGPRRVHMMGAHGLVMSAFSRKLPSTIHQNLLLEAYIYHVSISNMFCGIKSTPLSDQYISDLLCILIKASERVCPGPVWKMTSLVGSSPKVLDHVFRTSQLWRRIPLQKPDIAEASRLEQLLAQPELLNSPSPVEAEPESIPPIEMTLTRDFYTLGCMMLLQKMQNLAARPSDEIPRSIFQQARLLLSQLPMLERRKPTLTWPLLILGCAAIAPDERAEFLAPIEENIKEKWLGSPTKTHQILMRAWEFDDLRGRELGLDALMDHDLVSVVFL
ncbi:hypothetical protein B0O99DRAFT_136924 [Bisporella sp. PMI_857]|nr:hypothetical protein B0O99DRAFT_136924 [Bisporella sp. PMI_857]